MLTNISAILNIIFKVLCELQNISVEFGIRTLLVYAVSIYVNTHFITLPRINHYPSATDVTSNRHRKSNPVLLLRCFAGYLSISFSTFLCRRRPLPVSVGTTAETWRAHMKSYDYRVSTRQGQELMMVLIGVLSVK